VIKLSDGQPVFGYLRVDIEKFIATVFNMTDKCEMCYFMDKTYGEVYMNIVIVKRYLKRYKELNSNYKPFEDCLNKLNINHDC